MVRAPALLLIAVLAVSCSLPSLAPTSAEPLPQNDGQLDHSRTTMDTHLSDLYVRAAQHLRDGETEAAAELYRQAIREYPSDSLGYTSLGATHVMREEYAEANVAYGRALAIDPDQVEAHYGLGAVAYELNDRATAIVHLEHALARDPNHAASLRLMRLSRP